MELSKYQKDILKWVEEEQGNLVIDSSAGSSKALALYEQVLTPNGFVDINRVKVGGKVVNPDSDIPSEVVGVYPQGITDLYKVSFDDGTSINCSPDHLWYVKSRYSLLMHVKPLTDLLVDYIKIKRGRKFYKYSVEVYYPTPFTFKRYSSIVSIEQIGSEETVCIRVDNPNGLFVTSHYKVTHNSTTLLEICKNPKVNNAALLAFNTHIAKHLNSKIDRKGVEAKTNHALGRALLVNHLGRDLKLDADKYRNLIKEDVANWLGDITIQHYRNMNPKAKLADYEIKSLLTQVLCKATSLTQGSLGNYDAKSIAELDEHFEFTDTKLFVSNDNISRVVTRVITEGIKIAESKKIISFDDMIYLPYVWDLHGSKYDWLLLDECIGGESLIVTEKGNIRIDSLVNSFVLGEELPKVKSFNIDNGVFEYKDICNGWHRGIRDVVEVTLGGKKKLKCTPDHRVLTLRGYVEAKDLTLDDALVSSSTDQPYKSLPTEGQIALMIGSRLGDGNLHRVSNNSYRVKISQGAKQEDYLRWKAELLGSSVSYLAAQGFSMTPLWLTRSKNYYIKTPLFSKLYAIDNSSIESVAISFMDDGSLSQAGTYSLYSCCQDSDLADLYNQKIYKLLGVLGKVQVENKKDGRKFYVIKYGVNEAKVLSESLSPYVHANLSYKILHEHRDLVGSFDWNLINKRLGYGCISVTNLRTLESKTEVFDIEVEDNHNFVIGSGGKRNGGGIVVKNCQDLSPSQLDLILRSSNKNTRFIAVGDPNQSINGFSSADCNSVDVIKEKLKATTLPLPISYRCPPNHIKFINSVCPYQETLAFKTEDGIIAPISIDDFIKLLKSGDGVIGRRNKDLVKMCLKVISNGKKATVKGKNIGVGLSNLIKKIAKSNVDINKLDGLMNAYYVKVSAKLKDDSKVEALSDKIESIRSCIDFYDPKNVDALVKNIDTLFTDSDEGVVFSSIHKFKGLQSQTIFIINYYCMPLKFVKNGSWQYQQELNCRYVALTRSEKDMYFVAENKDDYKKLENDINLHLGLNDTNN